MNNAKNKEYNGWKNYETWNVALWIGNDESLYQLAGLCTDYKDFLSNLSEFDGGGTQDGISWHHVDLDVEALDELIKEAK